MRTRDKKTGANGLGALDGFGFTPRKSVVRLGQQRLALGEIRGSRRRHGVQPARQAIGFVRLPGRCANLTFGAGARKTGCSWQAAIRFMCSMSKRMARFEPAVGQYRNDADRRDLEGRFD
jgi:hypothetical protein